MTNDRSLYRKIHVTMTSMLICLLSSAISASAQVAYPRPYDTTLRVNVIRTWDLSAPVTDSSIVSGLSLGKVRLTSQFFDGLGNPLQTVAKQASPTGKDMVTPVVYDNMLRESIKYLPFVSNTITTRDTTDNGYFKGDPFQQDSVFNNGQFPGENYYYAKATYEKAPSGRPTNGYAPGVSWVGNAKGTTQQYLVNKVSDSVQYWTISPNQGSTPTRVSAYAAGQLYKNVSIDERSLSNIEYKDKEGKVILKRIQNLSSPGTGHVGWLNTYYVYDSLGNLRFVISPKATEWLLSNSWNFAATNGSTVANELCYRYEYDTRNRQIIKKMPGAGETWMVYDKWNRVVLAQDSLLRVLHQWLFTKYDALNRPVVTGKYTNATYLTLSAMQGYLNTQNMARFENYQTSSFPLYSLTLSFPSVSSGDVLTYSYYDNYNWASWYGSYSSKDNTYDAQFSAASDNYPYPRSLSQNIQTRGLLTGTWDVAGSGIVRAIYYDDHGRSIQTKTYNFSGGTDIATMQYDFSGKTLATYLNHQKGGTNSQTHTVKSSMQYDSVGRLLTTVMNVDNTGNQMIHSNSYNSLAQLQNKTLGNNVDNLTYDYNIRGWITGINKNYVGASSSNWFGLELAYDKTTAVAGGTTYQRPILNGNIAGLTWRSKGDGINKKYDFSYDSANRFTQAIYQQKTNGSWESTTANFTMKGPDVDNNYGVKYDANGNILKSLTYGIKPASGNSLIDSLVYSYFDYSNRLKAVVDGSNDTASQLGDFHYAAGTKTTTDYAYDGNANLFSDQNKKISSITYDYHNLPSIIQFTGKGKIQYWYDDAGHKVKKQIVDSTVSGVKTTNYLYLNGFIYKDDTVQELAHPEGRVRWAFHKYLTAPAAYGWEYDFFERDHLGNTRVVLTQQKDTVKYRATMEAANRAFENSVFYNIGSTNVWSYYVNGSSGPNPFGTAITSPNDSVARISGSTPKEGPAIILKVMAGDRYEVGVQGFWKSPQSTGGTTDAISDILSSLANGIVSAAGTSKGTYSALSNTSTSPLLSAVNNFRYRWNSEPSSNPKAYLNFMALDNQFNYDSTASGAKKMLGSDTLATLVTDTIITIKKNGFLYIYLSNEEKNIQVFFDNLTVTHYSGPLLEETHYYPYGLSMAGISDKALKSNYAENKFKFNKASELQNKEFSDGSGLELYETPLRSLDPQLGRWWQLDPKPAEGGSPYASMGNNPILYNDPAGDTIDFPLNDPKFIGKFYAAYEKLVLAGQGDRLTYLMNMPEHLPVYEQVGYGLSYYHGGILWWNPNQAIKTTLGVVLTATAILDHEADHAAFFYSSTAYGKTGLPYAYFIGALPLILDAIKDDTWTDMDEKRVITGSEQKTALALGLIKKGQVTRNDHFGSVIPTSGINSTNDLSKDKFNTPARKKSQKGLAPQHPKPMKDTHDQPNPDDPHHDNPPVLH